MSTLQQNNTTNITQNLEQSSNKGIRRTKKHEAILKIKEFTEHIEVMKKRHQRLKVIDDQHRSKTIEHERKIQQYQKKRDSIKKDKEKTQKVSRLRMYEAEVIKQKNKKFKEETLKKIAESFQIFNSQKIQRYRNMKQQQQKNENKIMQNEQSDLKQKQEIKKNVNEMQYISKANISRYKQQKQRQTKQYISLQFGQLMEKALKREKYFQKLSKIEEQMVKKNSQSMQMSQVMKNKFRQILGDQRRFTLLPQINKNKSLTTRVSTTGNTHILAL